MKKRTEAVDIIIPVYNGYDDLQLCMPSVLKHTDLTKHRLILINDCSPDERIAPYLDSFSGNIFWYCTMKKIWDSPQT